jgi:signal transduction histidine kinase
VVTLKRNLKDLAYIENKNQFYNSSEYQIILQKGTQVLQIVVEDNGPGISKNNLNKIFDPFFTTKTNGTGLGLAMVKRTINKHGGIILVKSTPNDKTTFKLILPYRR